eukprot:1921879-Prymnesium_polylepis.1
MRPLSSPSELCARRRLATPLLCESSACSCCAAIASSSALSLRSSVEITGADCTARTSPIRLSL